MEQAKVVQNLKNNSTKSDSTRLRYDSKYVLPKNLSPQEMKLFDVWDLRVLGKKNRYQWRLWCQFS